MVRLEGGVPLRDSMLVDDSRLGEWTDMFPTLLLEKVDDSTWYHRGQRRPERSRMHEPAEDSTQHKKSPRVRAEDESQSFKYAERTRPRGALGRYGTPSFRGRRAGRQTGRQADRQTDTESARWGNGGPPVGRAASRLAIGRRRGRRACMCCSRTLGADAVRNTRLSIDPGLPAAITAGVGGFQR